VEAEFSGLRMKLRCPSVPPTLFLLLKNCCVVFLLCRDHVVYDPGELVGGGIHRLWSTHSSFHAPEVIAQKCVASV
jgi:hypothetical protein